MKIIQKFYCTIEGWWDTLISFLKTGDSTKIDGCLYSKHEVYRNKRVIVSYCEYCDKPSFSWENEDNNDAELIKYYGTCNSELQK